MNESKEAAMVDVDAMIEMIIFFFPFNSRFLISKKGERYGLKIDGGADRPLPLIATSESLFSSHNDAVSYVEHYLWSIHERITREVLQEGSDAYDYVHVWHKKLQGRGEECFLRPALIQWILDELGKEEEGGVHCVQAREYSR